MRLARVGIENVVGYVEGGIPAWEQAGLQLSQVPQISVLDLYGQIRNQPGDIQVVDVRRAGEWEAGHIRGARLKPLNRFALGSADVPHADLHTAKPVAVHCQSGYRSSIAASLLQRAGHPLVMNVIGGFDAWQAQGLPAERVRDVREQAGNRDSGSF